MFKTLQYFRTNLFICFFKRKKRYFHYYMFLICFAGFPTHSVFGGISLKTTLPAPIIAFSPIVIPGSMVALAPIEAPLLTRVLRNISGYCFDLGRRSLVKVTFGPINTSSSKYTPSQI